MGDEGRHHESRHHSLREFQIRVNAADAHCEGRRSLEVGGQAEHSVSA